MVDETYSTDSLKIAHSTVSNEEIACVVQKHYDIRLIDDCYLLQSGYNDVYIFECVDQSRWIARLRGIRPSGPGNIEYGVSMLDHLSAKGVGVGVAEAIRPRSGNAGVEVQLAEGPRRLVLFHFLSYENPKTLEDWESTRLGLAKIHNASEGHRGPFNLYTLDMDHLLRSPISWLLPAPSLDASLGELLKKLATDIGSDLQALGDLSWVACHGDCHGGNNFIRVSSSGEREAMPVFVRMRHLLWFSERAGRRDQWGIGALPLLRLREEAKLLEHWREEL